KRRPCCRHEEISRAIVVEGVLSVRALIRGFKLSMLSRNLESIIANRSSYRTCSAPSVRNGRILFSNLLYISQLPTFAPTQPNRQPKSEVRGMRNCNFLAQFCGLLRTITRRNPDLALVSIEFTRRWSSGQIGEPGLARRSARTSRGTDCAGNGGPSRISET